MVREFKYAQNFRDFSVTPFTLFIMTIISWAILMGISAFLSQELAIKGSYLFFGCAIACLVLFFENNFERDSHFRVLDDGAGVKIIVLLFLVSLALSIFSGGNPTGIVLIPLMALVIIFQLAENTLPWLLYIEIALVYTLYPLNRFLTTGFYYGNGDLIPDHAGVESVVSTGRIDGIYSIYSLFPGPYIEGGILQIITDLPIATIAWLPSTFLYFGALLAILSVVRRALSFEISVFVGVVFLSYPQLIVAPSMYHGANLVAALLALIILPGVGYSKRSLTTVLPILGFWIISHQISFFMILSLSVVYFLGSLFSGKLQLGRYRPILITIGLSWVGAMTWWVFVADDFVTQLVTTLNVHLLTGTDLFLTFDRSASPTYHFGSISTSSGVIDVLHLPSLFYQTILITLLILGGASIINSVWENGLEQTLTGLLAVGFVGSLGFFKTPFTYRLISRFGVLAAPALVTVAGIGLHKIVRSTNTPRKSAFLSVFIIAILVVSGGWMATNSSDHRLEEAPESAFTHSEFDSIKQTGEFIKQHSSSASSLWTTRSGLSSFGDVPSNSLATPNVSNNSITADGLLVVREKWDGNRIISERHGQKAAHTFITFDQGSLQRAKNRTSIIYESGPYSLAWEKNKTRLLS